MNFGDKAGTSNSNDNGLFEDLMPVTIKSYKFCTRNGNSVETPDPDNEDQIWEIEVSVNGKFTNRFAAWGGTPMGKVHPWAKVFIACGLEPNKANPQDIVGKTVNAVFYATNNKKNNGGYFSDIWKLLPLKTSIEDVRQMIQFGFQKSEKFKAKFNPQSMWRSENVEPEGINTTPPENDEPPF